MQLPLVLVLLALQGLVQGGLVLAALPQQTRRIRIRAALVQLGKPLAGKLGAELRLPRAGEGKLARRLQRPQAHLPQMPNPALGRPDLALMHHRAMSVMSAAKAQRAKSLLRPRHEKAVLAVGNLPPALHQAENRPLRLHEKSAKRAMPSVLTTTAATAAAEEAAMTAGQRAVMATALAALQPSRLPQERQQQRQLESQEARPAPRRLLKLLRLQLPQRNARQTRLGAWQWMLTPALALALRRTLTVATNLVPRPARAQAQALTTTEQPSARLQRRLNRAACAVSC